mgnify:CR=1 FL=1
MYQEEVVVVKEEVKEVEVKEVEEEVLDAAVPVVEAQEVRAVLVAKDVGVIACNLHKIVRRLF